eukprot:2345298-Rhodomonas_salina.2
MDGWMEGGRESFPVQVQRLQLLPHRQPNTMIRYVSTGHGVPAAQWPISAPEIAKRKPRTAEEMLPAMLLSEHLNEQFRQCNTEILFCLANHIICRVTVLSVPENE